MSSLRFFEVHQFARALVAGAAMELYLTPKPGLVDLSDSGAHRDLSVPVMEDSIGIIFDYMKELLRSLVEGEGFAGQTAIGRGAEDAIFRKLGTNTHKGYIFLSGLLLVARWHADSSGESSLRPCIASLAGQFFERHGEGETNGRQARVRFQTGGIVREALEGLPSLFDHAVPAYREAFVRHGCASTASFAMLARLMQTVEDTTTLHRCGTFGLARIRRDGRHLEELIEEGGDWMAFLENLNAEYVRMNLTMGGVADMLALSFGYLVAVGAIRTCRADQGASGSVEETSSPPPPP